MAIAVEINEYVELVGIIADLSGCVSYKCKNKEINEYFSSYKKHPAVKAVKHLCGENINTLVSLSSLLEYKRGKFVLRKESICLRKSDEILVLLADFYKVSSFHKFFKQMSGFYGEAKAQWENLLSSFNEDWFKFFFGNNEQEDFSVIVSSILNRLVISSKKDVIVSEFVGDILTIIRAFCHIYIDPFLCGSDKRQEILQPCADKILSFSKWAMRQQGYDDWRVLLNEYIVRAVANVYMQENNFTKQDIRNDIMDNIGRGFYLMPELVGYLNKYRYCRDKFKNFGEFYFELAKFFSSHIEKEIKRVDDIVSVILEV